MRDLDTVHRRAIINRFHNLHPLLSSVFLPMSLGSGLLLLFLIPPYQIPDEPMHFRRVLAVAQGDLVATVAEAGQVGSPLPSNLPEFERVHLTDMVGNPDQNFSSARLNATAGMGRVADQRFLPYPTAALFSPVPYLVPAAGAALAEILGGGYLASLYSARGANLLLSCIITWIALRIAPRMTELLIVLYFFPMSLFLRSSVSADVVTISLSWLLIAIVVRELDGSAEGAPPPPVKAFVAALLILTKPLFILVALLALLHPLMERQWKRLLGQAAVVAVAGILAALITAPALVPVRSDVPTDPGGQIARTFEQPLEVGGSVANDLLQSGPRYARELVGRLGWLDTPIPFALAALLAAALFAIALLTPSPNRMTVRIRFIMIVLTAMGVAGIVWANFVLWTPPQSRVIEGTQGRHFLPLVPLALVALTGVTARLPTVREIMSWSAAISAATTTIVVVLYRYWI